MKKRLSMLGIALLVVGLAFVGSGAVAYTQVQDGYDSLQAFSAAQNVELSYDDAGNLTDRGTTEGADAIMQLLTDEWQYPVVNGDLDPNDPLVNTGTEYMYQMATVAYHVMNGTQTVTLTEDVEYNGENYAAGTYDVPVDGRYWTGFDRSDPLDGPAREQAWTGTVHGLVGELGVGTVTHSTLQLALGVSALLGGLGLIFLMTGAGLLWAVRGKFESEIPDTVPDEFLETSMVEARV